MKTKQRIREHDLGGLSESLDGKAPRMSNSRAVKIAVAVEWQMLHESAALRSKSRIRHSALTLAKKTRHKSKKINPVLHESLRALRNVRAILVRHSVRGRNFQSHEWCYVRTARGMCCFPRKALSLPLSTVITLHDLHCLGSLNGPMKVAPSMHMPLKL